jgi:hypothetical protein
MTSCTAAGTRSGLALAAAASVSLFSLASSATSSRTKNGLPPVVDETHDGVGDGRPYSLSHQGGDVRLVEPLQGHPDGTGLAGNLGEEVDERGLRVACDRPAGDDQERPHPAQLSDQELEEPERGGIGPLDVVHHQEQRVGRRGQRPAERHVEREPFGGRVAPRLAGCDRGEGRRRQDAGRLELLDDLVGGPERGGGTVLGAPAPGNGEAHVLAAGASSWTSRVLPIPGSPLTTAAALWPATA